MMSTLIIISLRLNAHVTELLHIYQQSIILFGYQQLLKTFIDAVFPCTVGDVQKLSDITNTYINEKQFNILQQILYKRSDT
jgi:hypothetical protein